MSRHVRSRTLLIGFSLLAITCGTALQNPPKAADTSRTTDGRLKYEDMKLEAKHAPLSQRPTRVSMIRLIATPERYHNKAVLVTGFCHDEEEDSAIYLSTEDADYLSQNAIWVHGFGGLDFNRKFVVVEGIFDKDSQGHMDAYAGGIRDPWRITEQRRFYNDHGRDHPRPLPK